MMMLASALLTAVLATTPTAASPPPVEARAQAQAFVRIVIAAEIRAGRSDAPHQRATRRDEAGRPQILLQFE